jgi:UDP-N-acetylglucosamine--N-acetylmuramyl-(pentapeptide) pyrophosphoryl-undecaprenol N-acetylglucosamine transferase
MKPLKFILSGGGTGGHIYPAIAVAQALRQKYSDAQFLFVGAKDRMEMEKVPQAGFEIEGLWISGLQRKLTIKNLNFPLKLISSIQNSKKIIKKFQPDVVIGTGGFASGPLLYAATQYKIPTLIQEQNSFPGITNKILGPRVDTICVAYEGLEAFFPAKKIVLTGNPVREDLMVSSKNKKEALAHFTLKADKMTLLVLGGSLGARNINLLIEEKLDFLQKEGVQILWQTGKLYYETYKKYDSEAIRVVPFISEMDKAYETADLILTRSGALTVSELCLVGKSVIFIPSPNVAEDHQTKNAQAIAKQDAALVLKESEASQQFENMMAPLLKSAEAREKLGKAIQKLAKPDATEKIVAEIEKLISKKS